MSSLKHPLIRYHGGKYRFADWIISQFPSHRTYVEPFGGGASVLLSKTPSQIEVYNDLDEDVVNLFRVLRNLEQRQQLEQQLYFTPFSRSEFYLAYENTDCPIEKARRMIVRAQMGFGSAGATKGCTGFRRVGGRQRNYEIQIWNKYPSRLNVYAERLKKVLIENQEASKVINYYDDSDTLFFVDPPYVRSTRTANISAYQYEMSDKAHIELLDQLNQVKGFVVLSGYECDLYDTRLKHWKKLTKQVQASGKMGGVSRQECIWINPRASVNSDLFSGVMP
ncbi:DNA adenine methylase [Acinetobacter vivianii]|uniref:DNA adenine methylase n=1 Tax=Acinetobacter vivianii TaxID=1776742 RepID=UPI00404316AF